MESKTNKAIRILMVLPVLGQPRHAKRIDMLIDSGFDVEILSFDRDWPKGRMPKVPVHIIGHIEHRKYLRRLPLLVKAYRMIKARTAVFELIYCFGHDLTLISALASRDTGTKIVLEVGDIFPIQEKSGLIGTLFRFFDRFTMKAVSILVLVSEGFIDFYKNRLKYRNAYLVIENKIEIGSIRIDREIYIEQNRYKTNNGKISIGYFGVIGGQWGLSVLDRLAKVYKSKFNIVIAGHIANQKEVDRLLTENKNVEYLGPYRSPEDLADIYSKIDLSWACYPPFQKNDINYLSGRPNRFYEACFFGVPIVARKYAAFSNDVEKYEIGKIIETADVDETAHQLSEISNTDLMRWRDNMKSLPDNVFMLVDEPTRLRDEIIKCSQ